MNQPVIEQSRRRSGWDDSVARNLKGDEAVVANVQDENHGRSKSNTKVFEHIEAIMRGILKTRIPIWPREAHLYAKAKEALYLWVAAVRKEPWDDAVNIKMLFDKIVTNQDLKVWATKSV